MATLKQLMTLLSKEDLLDQREDIIREWTKGRTQSAKELTPTELDELCRVLTLDSQKALDKKRKRVLAAIFGFHKKMNKPATMEYVRGVACKAAKVDHFNQITPSRLDSIYNAFLKAQKDLDFANKFVEGYILESQCYN